MTCNGICRPPDPQAQLQNRAALLQGYIGTITSAQGTLRAVPVPHPKLQSLVDMVSNGFGDAVNHFTSALGYLQNPAIPPADRVNSSYHDTQLGLNRMAALANQMRTFDFPPEYANAAKVAPNCQRAGFDDQPRATKPGG